LMVNVWVVTGGQYICKRKFCVQRLSRAQQSW
jgi:hypothetical protein